MSNDKQSSLEWYRQEIMKILFDSSDNTLIYEIDIFNKAKAMHKEEIKKSYTTGFGANLHQAEHYYNTTFGGNNED